MYEYLVQTTTRSSIKNPRGRVNTLSGYYDIFKDTLSLTTQRYKDYMQSSAWKRKKAKYWKSRYPKVCYVCGRGRHRGMHLHHRTYVRLGRERLSDLVPACANCHRYIHDFHGRNSFMTLNAATVKCRNALNPGAKQKRKKK